MVVSGRGVAGPKGWRSGCEPAALESESFPGCPPGPRAREGNQGTTLTPARPAHTPNASPSDQPLPDLTPPYGPAPQRARLHSRSRLRRKLGQPLDNNSKEDSSCCAAELSRRAAEHLQRVPLGCGYRGQLLANEPDVPALGGQGGP